MSSIRQWLEVVKKGYGDRFVGAFNEVGVEDVGDLAELAEVDAFNQLERALEVRGAKLVQLQRIRKALLGMSASRPPRHAGLNGAAGLAGHPALKAMRSPDAALGLKVEKPLLKNVFGLGLPVMKPQAPRAAAAPSPQGYSVLQAGTGPRIYTVHGIDGDHLAAGADFRRFAAFLGSCHVVALEYNEEARTCGTLEALAALYNQRILNDVQAGPARSIYLAGYSMGCILAHQMALQFQEAGAQVGLLLFGSEVAWPAGGSSTRRLGGYAWLGGSIEAALHVARGLGAVDYAEGEVRALLACRAEERDANKVHMRVYWKHAGPSDMPYEDFQHAISVGARNMDILCALMQHFEPRQAFEGYTLLLLAPESPEFATARDVNARHCICLKTVSADGMGSHYNMLQGAQAPVVANAVLASLREQGENVSSVTIPAYAAFTPVPAAAGAAAPVVPTAAARAATTAAAAGLPAPPARDSLKPQVRLDDVDATLIGLVNGISMEPLQMDDSFVDSGFDSISMSLLVTQIQTGFDVEVSQATLMDNISVADLAKLIYASVPDAKPGSQVAPVVTSLQPQPVAAAVAPAAPPALPAGTAALMAAEAAEAARTTALAPASTAGLETLHVGSGPRVYMVHGIDGDIWGIGNSFRAVAPLLEPCSCCALACDEEALACGSLPALAAAYNRRVRADAERHPPSQVFILGYSMGCVIAHQMALQLQNGGMNVGLVMVDFEVTWPPEPTTKRVGGYKWLGGEIEAPLLMARSMGLESQMWAAREIEELLAKPPSERDPAGVQARVFAEIASRRRGFRLSDYNAFVTKGGRNMDLLHAMADKFEPTGVFLGDALLVLAPDSPENTEPALEINARYCKNMQAVKALGTHYNILQPERAGAAARVILGFMARLGHEVSTSPSFRVRGLECLSDGEGPRVYMAHGIEANLYGVGQSYRALAPLLAPCCCSAFAFDEEAQSCKDFQALAGLYCNRAWQDAQFYPDRPVVVMGYSMGCVIAHAIALLFQERGLKVTLVLVDFEVTWPPEPSQLRIGGYNWLGGELEAPLLIARSFGRELQQWTGEEIHKFLGLPAQDRNVAMFQARIFQKCTAARKGFTLQVFETYVTKGGRIMERLHEVMGTAAPKGVFHGETLLVLAPDSPENTEPALRVNTQYCSKMQDVKAVGTHYTILQQGLASVAADRILRFLRQVGHDVPSGVPLVIPGVETLHEGTNDSPLVYMVHGMDGLADGPGQCYKTLAPLLDPCSCSSLAYDEEARKAESVEALAEAYLFRIYQHSQLHPSRPIFILGSCVGCAIAHSLVLKAQGHKWPLRLLLIGSGVAWPPAATRLRVGGYEWLGGEIEAMLGAARTLGAAGQDWASRELEALLAQPAAGRDARGLRARFLREQGPQWQEVAPQGFESYVAEAARNMERLRTTVAGYKPPATFEGETLLVRSADDAAPAEDLDATQLGKWEVVKTPGTHDGILQKKHAWATARAILDFVQKFPVVDVTAQ